MNRILLILLSSLLSLEYALAQAIVPSPGYTVPGKNPNAVAPSPAYSTTNAVETGIGPNITPTQPTVSTTHELRTLRIEKTGNSTLLSWFAETNRIYTLHFSLTFTETNWVNLAEVRGQGIRTNVLVPRFWNSGFYRFSVR